MRKVAIPMVSSAADERRLATDLVAQVPEEDRSERAGDHGGTEDGEGCQERGRVVPRREEEVREDEDRSGGVDVEVVELDRRADQAGEDDPRLRIGRGLGSGGG